jgi:hypothetical protein
MVSTYLPGETIYETRTSSLFCTSQIVPDLLERFLLCLILQRIPTPDDELLWALEGLIEK